MRLPGSVKKEKKIKTISKPLRRPLGFGVTRWQTTHTKIPKLIKSFPLFSDVAWMEGDIVEGRGGGEMRGETEMKIKKIEGKDRRVRRDTEDDERGGMRGERRDRMRGERE